MVHRNRLIPDWEKSAYNKIQACMGNDFVYFKLENHLKQQQQQKKELLGTLQLE